MKLKFIAISDTHLGSESSILSYAAGVEHLWESVRAQFGLSRHEHLKVDELVLLGDILDRTTASVETAQSHMNTFLSGLADRINSRKLIYMPGNHDHTVWTKYIESISGIAKSYGVTGPNGETIVQKGCVQLNLNKWLSANFCYPEADFWRKMDERICTDVVVANPIYAKAFHDRTYVFAHGTHFRHEFTVPKWLLQIIKKLFSLDASKKIDEHLHKMQHPLEEIERILSPIIDAVWAEAKNDVGRRRTRIYHSLRKLYAQILGYRKSPNASELFKWADLKNVPHERVNRLTEEGAANSWGVSLWEKHFLPHVISFLKQNALAHKKLTFVYGDTHHGGWGALSPSTGDIRLYNCGSWVTYTHDHHPPTHVFAVDHRNEEYMLDVSFKNVKIGDKMLLDAVAPPDTQLFKSAALLISLILRAL